MQSVFFDFSNLCVRCLFSKDVINENNEIDWEVWEFRVMNSILSSLFYQKDLSDVIIAIDSIDSWRREFFTKYKSERKEKREKVEIDWHEFYQKMEDLSKEIADYLPFKVLSIDKAEADDIIAVLALNLPGEKTIISTDNDFIQLLKEDIYLYNPMKQKFISHPNPSHYLKEQILMGQNKHSIPNVKTPLSWPSSYLRKPGLGPKTCEKILIQSLNNFLEEDISYRKSYKDEEGNTQVFKEKVSPKERYQQNKKLMDLTEIPEYIKEKIIDSYNRYNYPFPSNIYEFFKNKNWRDYIEEFTKWENKIMELYKNENYKIK